MSTHDELLVRDLAMNAAQKAVASIRLVSDSAPDGLRVAVLVNAMIWLKLALENGVTAGLSALEREQAGG